MNHVIAPDSQIVGQFRRFGPFGPVYEVTGLGRLDDTGARWLNIRIVESGEELEYPLADVQQDLFEA
jgi:hypothetical protein